MRRAIGAVADKSEVGANWYSIRRTFADWPDERGSEAAISPVLGHFDISTRTRRQLFDAGRPTTNLYKRTKRGPVFEFADVLKRECWPSISRLRV